MVSTRHFESVIHCIQDHYGEGEIMRFVALSALFGGVLYAASAWAGSPASMVPRPRAESCIPFDADPDENEMAVPDGLSFNEVTVALNSVIQYALHCEQPEGRSALNLTFELQVGCNGLVSSIKTIEDDSAPEEYISCVSSVIERADFPAHDMEGGMPITYPVNVAW